ncbi:MAG TPA: hypothetical protein VIP11_06375 [Gemmatimonadaceae bacterium]
MNDIAAELTLRVARFLQMPDGPPASPARWFFVPEFYSAGWDEAGSLLAEAPKPLIVAPLPDPGFLGTWFLGALKGVHRSRAEHQLQNQQAFFAAQLQHLGLTDTHTIVFESGADESVVDVATFKRWLQEYVVCAGSTLQRSAPAPHSAALLIRRPHGGWSPGMTCGYLPPAS